MAQGKRSSIVRNHQIMPFSGFERPPRPAARVPVKLAMPNPIDAMTAPFCHLPSPSWRRAQSAVKICLV